MSENPYESPRAIGPDPSNRWHLILICAVGVITGSSTLGHIVWSGNLLDPFCFFMFFVPIGVLTSMMLFAFVINWRLNDPT